MRAAAHRIAKQIAEAQVRAERAEALVASQAATIEDERHRAELAEAEVARLKILLESYHV